MYILAQPDHHCRQLIDIISQYLTSTFGTHFINQLDPSAGLGSHPYHITLIGKIGSINANELDIFLSRWRNDHDVVEVIPTNLIKATHNGLVLWLVSSPSLNQIGSEILRELRSHLRKNYDVYETTLDSYIDQKYLHITLGILTTPTLFGKTFTLPTNLIPEDISFSIDGFGWNY